MKRAIKAILIGLLVNPALRPIPLFAGNSGALTLLEDFGAKPASLGEAYSAVSNDLSAMGYNPAGISNLDSGQASFLYNKGAAEDAFGRASIAAPMKKGGAL